VDLAVFFNLGHFKKLLYITLAMMRKVQSCAVEIVGLITIKIIHQKNIDG